MYQFSAVVTVNYIHVIGIAVAVFVGFLNATAHRSVITGNGETQLRAVGQVERALHQSFSERAPSDDDTAVVILNGTGNDFCGRGGIFVHQHGYFAIFKTTVSFGFVFRIRSAAAFGVNNQVVLVQKLVGNVDCCAQIAATVLLQVQNQVFHSLFFQFVHRLFQLFMRFCAEAADPDQTRLRSNHIGGIYRSHRNLVAFYIKLQHLVNTIAHDAQTHDGTFRTFQAAHDFLAAHFHAGNGSVVYGDNPVSGQDTGFFRGAFAYGLYHEQSIFEHVVLHADTLEIALQRFVHGLGVFGVRVGRMRIKLLEHAHDGILRQFVGVHAVYIQAADGQMRHIKLFDGSLIGCGRIFLLAPCRQTA